MRSELEVLRNRCQEYERSVQNWQTKYFQCMREGAFTDTQKLDFLGKTYLTKNPKLEDSNKVSLTGKIL
jgi:hypothetical protein